MTHEEALNVLRELMPHIRTGNDEPFSKDKAADAFEVFNDWLAKHIPPQDDLAVVLGHGDVAEVLGALELAITIYRVTGDQFSVANYDDIKERIENQLRDRVDQLRNRTEQQ